MAEDLRPPEPPPSDAPGAADGPVLVVGLSTLSLHGEVLHEAFWATLAEDWRLVRKLMARSGVRRFLGSRSREVQAAEEVLARMRAWRAQGGRTALITRVDQRLAEQIAAKIGIFDEVHGSDETRTLVGPVRLRFMAERYGPEGYVCLDTGTGAPESAVAARPLPAEAAPDPDGSTPRVLLEALRPHQWLKNLLVFVPLVPDRITDPQSILLAVMAFVAMSSVASAGYVLNDLLDLADDRTHPRKKTRPFASGRLRVATGTTMVPVLLAFGLALAALVSAPLFAVVACYFVATVTYSVKLKRLALVDVLTLGMLYTARIVAGGMAIGADLSVWLLAFSLFIFFSLAAVKRQAELTEAATRGVRRETRRGYRVEDRAVVTQMAVASGYVATLVFALYVQEELATGRYAQPEVLWLICPLLLYWISRMVLVAGRGEMHDDPLVYALKAPASRNVIALIATVLVIAVLL